MRFIAGSEKEANALRFIILIVLWFILFLFCCFHHSIKRSDQSTPELRWNLSQWIFLDTGPPRPARRVPVQHRHHSVALVQHFRRRQVNVDVVVAPRQRPGLLVLARRDPERWPLVECLGHALRQVLYDVKPEPELVDPSHGSREHAVGLVEPVSDVDRDVCELDHSEF